MVVSHDIFDLIRSLSSSEKRYFKLFIKIHEGEKDYLKLFEAIDEQKEYDEDALRKKFEGESFLRRFSAAKNYLYNQVLRSLRAYHSESSANAQIRETFHSIEILHEKGLIEQADKLLRRAYKLAQKHGKHALFLESLRIGSELSYSKDASNTIAAGEFETILDQQDETLGQLSFELELQKLKFYLSYDFTHEERKQSDDFYRERIEELKDRSENTLSTQHKVDRELVLGLWSLLQKDMQGYYEHFRAAHDLMGSESSLLREDPHSYITITFYLIQAQYNLLKHEELFATIRTLRENTNALGKILRTAEAKIFFSSYFWEIFTLLGIREIDRAHAIIPDIESGLRRYRQQIPPYFAVMLELFIAMAYYSKGDLTNSLKKLNYVLEHQKTIREGGVTYYIVLLQMNLMIHYELGHRDLLESLLRSVRRSFGKSEIKPDQVAEYVFSFFETVTGTISIHEECDALKELKDHVREVIEGNRMYSASMNRMGLPAFMERTATRLKC